MNPEVKRTRLLVCLHCFLVCLVCQTIRLHGVSYLWYIVGTSPVRLVYQHLEKNVFYVVGYVLTFKAIYLVFIWASYL